MLQSLLAAFAAALVVVFGGSVARADSATTVVYNAVPSLLPPNMASLGFQATQTSEFGDYVHLAGANRALRTVTVAMSDWALNSDYPSMPSAGWSHPITLNIYNTVPGTLLNTVGSRLGTVTQTFTIPWRPAADPTCLGGTAWRAADGLCYNGFAFTITFDLGSLNLTLPNDVVVGVAYNTANYGAHPIGAAGPYNSLNVGLRGSVGAGTDDNADRVFWNTSTAANYTDNGVGGVGTFREDATWTPNGTLPIQITVAPSVSDNADLTSLSLSSGLLSPGFSSSTTSYSASVGNGVVAVTVTATANPGAGVVVSGGSSLAVGSNTVTITVTAGDGTTTKTYTVVVNRALSSNADLTGLSLSSGSLSPGFSSSTTSYRVAVDNGVTAVVVGAVAADSGASVSVSGGLDLSVGDVTVSVAVTAADGTTKLYTIIVERAATPVAGATTAVRAAPEQAGVVSVVVFPTASAAGTTTPAVPAVSIVTSWAANTFAVPVEVTVVPQEITSAGRGATPIPQPVPGGFSVGSAVVQLTVTDASTGESITSFQKPVKIHLSAIQPGDTPAFSQDGVTWTRIPQLSSPELPSGRQDGYVLNADGSVDIYTLHATLFGLLTDAQAPIKPTVEAQVGGKKLYLLIRSRDNVAMAYYLTAFNGRVVKRSPHAYLVLAISRAPVRVQVTAVDKAGNQSKLSTAIKIVPTGNKKHPFKITR